MSRRDLGYSIEYFFEVMRIGENFVVQIEGKTETVAREESFKDLICNQTRSWSIRVLAVPCECVKKPRKWEHCVV